MARLTWNPDTFAYAGAVDELSGRYSGLVAGARPMVTLDGASVVVRPDAAGRQLEVDGRGTEATGMPPEPDREPSLPARFHGRRTLEPGRLLRDVGDIADAIVRQLARAPDAEVSITVDIDASAAGGFDEDVRRTVTENARTLEFDTHEFESE